MLFLLLIITSFPYGEVITDINVEGVENVDTALVISTSGLRIGDVLKRNESIKAVKNIYSTDLFRNIELDAKREGAGINVIIRVNENPSLKSIDFVGNDILGDADLASIVDLSPPALLSDYKLFRIKQKILDLYREEGVTGTEIEIEKEVDEDKVRVTFNIDEGKKYKVVQITFEGNKSLSDHALCGPLSNKTRPWWMFWRDNSLKIDSIPADIPDIEGLYRKNGFLDAEVVSHSVDYKDKGAIINYTVEEGRLYYFGDYKFDGAEDTSKVIDRIRWESGEVYNEEKINETMRELFNYYTDNGYLYASVVPGYSIRNDSIIDITFNIDKGPAVYVKLIKIKGNTQTYDKVIRRNLTIYPGELFRREKIINSQRNLFRLGYFENLNLEIENPENNDTINLILSVVEKQTGQFSAGFGFSQSVGLTGNVSATIPNLFGTGQAVRFSYEKTLRAGEGDNTIQNVSFSYNQPWLFDTPTSLGFELYRVYTRWYYYNQDKVGGAFSLGRILTADRNLHGMITYRLEKTDLRVDENVSEYLKELEGENWESSIKTGLNFDSRDSRIAASVGSYYSITTKYAGGILQGDLEYWKTILETRRYSEVWDKIVLMNRFRAGYVHSPSGKVPLPERFFMGGLGSWGLRGYDDRDIGPIADGYPSGGKFALVDNLELRYNFSRTGYAMIFLDAGNCYPDFQSSRLSELYYGIGAGFRIEIPMMGIFGIDLGYGLNDEKGGEWKPHFQLGMTY